MNYPAGGAKQARHAIKTARPNHPPGRPNENEDEDEGLPDDPHPPRMPRRPGSCFVPSVVIAVAAALHFVLDKRRRQAAAMELSPEELGMLKVIRDAAGELYDRHRPRPLTKVIDLCRIIRSRKGGEC